MWGIAWILRSRIPADFFEPLNAKQAWNMFYLVEHLLEVEERFRPCRGLGQGRKDLRTLRFCWLSVCKGKSYKFKYWVLARLISAELNILFVEFNLSEAKLTDITKSATLFWAKKTGLWAYFLSFPFSRFSYLPLCPPPVSSSLLPQLNPLCVVFFASLNLRVLIEASKNVCVVKSS